jgi:hypothetical protein
MKQNTKDEAQIVLKYSFTATQIMPEQGLSGLAYYTTLNLIFHPGVCLQSSAPWNMEFG